MANYTSEDYSFLYLDALRDFAISEGFPIAKRINISWLIDNFQQKFLEKLQSENEGLYISKYNFGNPTRLGQILVQAGILSFERLNQDKFSETHRGLLKTAIKMLGLPKYIKVNVIEEEPMDLNLQFVVDYFAMAKDPKSESFQYLRDKNKFIDILVDASGSQTGRSTSGRLEVDAFNPIYENMDKVVNEYLKKLRLSIKTSSEFSDFIKSIKIDSLSSDGGIILKSTFEGANDFRYKTRLQREHLREKFEEFRRVFAKRIADEMGYPGLKNLVKIISPTLERYY